MAIYHLHAQVIGRGKGRSSVAASAYRAACKLIEKVIDKETGFVFEIEHDYSKKHGVVFSKILAPENAPDWVHNRELFWNKIQNEFEVRKNSQFCRELDIALPKELSEEQNIQLLTEFVHEALVKEGMVADINFHNDNPENPHAHIMLSTREIVVGEDGNVTFGNKVRHWNSNEFLVHTRRMWAGYVNKYLELAGIEQEVSHLSHAERGIDLVPTIKEGVARFVNGAERREINRRICSYNEELIIDNPELIIDKLFRNKIVFTKEEVAKELFNIYTAEELFLATSEDNHSHENQQLSAAVQNDVDSGAANAQRSLSDYINGLERVMSSDKLALVEARDIDGKQLYTTKDRIELERSSFDIASSIKEGEQKHIVAITDEDLDKKSLGEKVVDKVKEVLGFDYDSIVLSQQQRKVILEVLGGGNVSVIEGLPGSGKTAAMREVVRQYKKAGYRVQGAAVSSSAARELASKTGIRAVNITKLRRELDQHAGRKFDLNLTMDYFKQNNDLSENKNHVQLGSKLSSKDVLIVDESSMVDLTEMHYLLSEARMSGAKLILLGDSNQLPSVGTGGAAEKMAEVFGVLRLNEVRRQSLDEHKRATRLLAEFKVAEAIELYRETDVFRFSKTQDKAKDILIRDYVNEYVSIVKGINDKAGSYRDRQGQIISSQLVALAYTNKDIAGLNKSIRARLTDEGAIIGKEYNFTVDRQGERGNIALAKGDQVVFTKNSEFLGIANSEVGEVIGFGRSRDGLRDTARIKVADNDTIIGKGSTRIVEVDDFYYKGLDYGYAVNIYKSQGKTYSSVFGLVDEYSGYNSFNVMATRHKDKLKLYASEEVLHAELYKKISLYPDQAARKYEIRSSYKDEDSSRYAGLVALIQKRGDTSLAIDYQNNTTNLASEVNIVTKYIEVRNEVIKVRQAIDNWLELERAKGRVRPHNESPYFDDLKPMLEERRALARTITENYEDYKKLLTQGKINYSTIEKHAGKGEHQYYFRRLDYSGSIQDINGFNKILELQDRISKYESGPLFASRLKEAAKELKDVTSILVESFEEHKLAIYEARLELEKAQDNKYKVESYIEDGKQYTEKNFLEYLDKTFKEGAEPTLKQWERLKQEKGQEVALALESVKLEPQILGKLKGIGIGSILALNKDRSVAAENIEVLAAKLEKYEEYKANLPQLEKQIEAREFEREITDKEIKLKELEAKLPSKLVQEYIVRADKAATAELNSINSFSYSENSNSSKQSRDVSNNPLVTWSKDAIVTEQSNRYREILNAKTSAILSGDNKDNQLFSKYEQIARNSKDYVKERESLLRTYEYSRNTDDRSKLYRHIAGSIEPDLAYDILKNLCFIGITEGKAKFLMINDTTTESRIQEMQSELLSIVQNNISLNIKEVEIYTRKQSLLKKQQEEVKGTKSFVGESREAIYLHLRDDIIDSKKDQDLLTFTAGDELKLEIKLERHLNIVICERVKNKEDLRREISYEEIMRAKQIYSQRDARIELLINNHEQVTEVAKEDQVAARCFAENLVDIKMCLPDKVLSNEIIEQQRIIALAQSNALKNLSQELSINTHLDSSKSKRDNDNILTKEVLREDSMQREEYIKHNLAKNLTEEMAKEKTIKLDVAKVQDITNQVVKRTDERIRTLQKQYLNTRQQEMQRNQQRLLNLNRGFTK